MYFPLWKLALVALPQLGVQVTWCFIGPNAPWTENYGSLTLKKHEKALTGVVDVESPRGQGSTIHGLFGSWCFTGHSEP